MSSTEQPSPGELTEELRRLLDAVLTRAGSAAPPPEHPAQHPPGAVGSDCGWCPVCAVAAALRGERPELTRRLAEHGVGLLTALRSLVEDHEHAEEDRPTGSTTDFPAPSAAGRVHRIPVRSTARSGE